MSTEGSDVVGKKAGIIAPDGTSSSDLYLNQSLSDSSSYSGGAKGKRGEELGSSLVNSLLFESGQQSRGGDGYHLTASDDDTPSSSALQAGTTTRPTPEGPENCTAGALDVFEDVAVGTRHYSLLPQEYALSFANGGRDNRTGGGGGGGGGEGREGRITPVAAPAQRTDDRENHGGSRRKTRVGSRTPVGRACPKHAPLSVANSSLKGDNAAADTERPHFSVVSCGNKGGNAALTWKHSSEVSVNNVSCPPDSSYPAGDLWSPEVLPPPNAVAPDNALPLRRARTSAVSDRRAAQALAFDTMALRARRRNESRGAGHARQQLFKSLGVGSKRTLRTATDGRGRLVVMAQVLPPGARPPSSVVARSKGDLADRLSLTSELQSKRHC